MIFSIKDSLRQAVEAASGGLCTVVYTQKGQPVFLRRIPRFNLEAIASDLGTGPHPAFVVGDREVPEIWVGMYPGVLSQGELISVPGVEPSRGGLNTMQTAARANGPGFHLMTVAEWAAVALLAMRGHNGEDPVRGNTDWGRDRDRHWETGVRVDGLAPGTRSGNPATLTGSGPLTWRHDGTAWGIADLVGNRHEWVAGLRLQNGQIQVSLHPFEENWQAITPNGNLVAPNTTGTLHYGAASGTQSTSGNLGAPVLRTTPTNVTGSAWVNGLFRNLTADTGVSVPPILRALLLFPSTTANPTRGWAFIALDGTQYVLRGGDAFLHDQPHGLSTLTTAQASSVASARVAYVL